MFHTPYNKQKLAFTLAEILLTLLVISVIAVLTVPSLMTRINDRVTLTKLDKVYSTLSNAYSRTIVEYPSINLWHLQDDTPEGSENFFNVMSKYMIVSKNCAHGLSSNLPCFSDKPFYTLDGNIWNPNFSQGYMFLSIDNTSYALFSKSSNCTQTIGSGIYEESVCGEILVDIDGPNKGANTLGRDIFSFALLKTGIVPTGGLNYTGFEGQSVGNNVVNNGWGASWWVLHKKNLDYLRCLDSLEFSIKDSCK